MKQAGSILALAGLVSLAQGHGFVTSPQARMPGSAMEKACGQQVYNNQEADNYGNVQGELQIASGQSDYNADACDIWLCKGYKYADNKDNVYSYTAGETVDFTVDIRAPHTGTANVSVVDTASNTVIGSPLIYWSVYASTSTGVTKNETSFSVTIPDDLGDKCTEGGACVLQWWWNAASIDQTYESCIDFTPTTTAAAAAVTTPSTANNVAPASSSVPTTLATSVKQSATVAPVAASSAAAAASSGVSIPTDGTAEEQLTWVASLLKALLKYAN
ncbi:Fungal specific transcription factor domain family protein [Aspergillus niger]|uniref:Fungal specific transcription factor domain family protein n=1 Tax=Aspergillus niger TaxID=5061 RepID=A0A505IHN7_ASPNG|nr:Fungal specific transcription factor domain family protein [Aspergillus niger]